MKTNKLTTTPQRRWQGWLSFWIVFASLICSFKGHAQYTPYAEPIIFDRFGNQHSVSDIKIPSNTNTGGGNQIIAPITCQAGYFLLFFADDPNKGFNDPTLGAARQSLICQVFTDLSKLIVPARDPITNATPLVRIYIGSSFKVPNGVYGLATSNYLSYREPFYGIGDGMEWQYLNTGVDPLANLTKYGYFDTQVGSYYHGLMKINFNVDSLPAGNIYHLDPNTPAASTETDLYTIVLHEALHGLGFTSLISSSGVPKAYFNFSRYDSKLHSVSHGDFLVDHSNCYASTFSIQDTNDVRSGCTNVKFGRGNDPVYAPASYNAGSSLSHLDGTCSGLEYVMSYSLPVGSMRRKPTTPEVDILCQIGYQISGEYGANPARTYSYGIYPPCGRKVAAVNDFYHFGTQNFYAVAPGNSIVLDDVLNNDVNTTSISCARMVSGDGQITNQTSTSITFQLNTASYEYNIIRYTPVGSNGELGNYAYIFIISLPDPPVCSSNNLCNLAANGDFERFRVCYNSFSFINSFYGWFTASTGTPDFFSKCAQFVGVPKNFAGYQQPHSGDSYAGVGIDEIIEGQLCQPLEAGRQYRVSLYASYSRSGVASNIGAAFSDTLVAQRNKSNLDQPFKPTIFVSNLTDSVNWTLVTGTYTAHGGEKYILVGPEDTPDGSAYYYIDDISVVPLGPSSACCRTYTGVLGLPGRVDTLTGVQTFHGGTWNVLNSIVFKNATVTIDQGAVFYIEGHTRILNSSRVITGSYIYLQNSTFNLNGATFQAACDTMWGGIRTIYPNSNDFTNNVVNMTNVGNQRATIKDAFIGFQFYEANNINETTPPVHTGSFNINGASFFNNRTGAYITKVFYPNTTNTITRTIFDSDGQLKAPFTNQYAKGSLLLYGNCKKDVYSDNSFKRGLFGVYSEGEIYTSKMERDTFVNNYMVGYYNPVSYVDTSVVNNCLFQFATSIPAGVNNTGTITGMYVGNLGFKANKNTFTAPNLPGYTTVGIANSLFADQGRLQYGYQINNNTFNTNNFAVNNLNFHTRLAQLVGNTFTSSKNAAILTDASPVGVPARSFIHCNDFIRGTSTQSAIVITASGVLSDSIGRCKMGETAGNNFVLYASAPTFAINNGGPGLVYSRSTYETSTLNTNGLNCPGVQFSNSCGQSSGCLGIGLGLPFPPIRQILEPATALVEIAVTTLKQGVVTPLTEQLRLITRIVDSYSGNCSPTYQNVVDQMLPNNLTAYNALAWNLTECYIANQNIPAAISLMQAINYHNPTDIAIQQRTNFYSVMLRLSGLSANGGYKATVQDINVLAQVAASGTPFSAAACYTLLGIAPDRATNCITYPAPLPAPPLFNLLGGNSSMAMDSPVLDSSALALKLRITPVLFDSKPNPFSVSTTVRYVVTDQVKTAILRIYDVQGSLVRSIQLDKTVNEVSISADGLKNGVYLYTIETDGISMVKKRLVVIK